MPSKQYSVDALIAFGANEGDCEATLTTTLQLFADEPGILQLSSSSPHKTKAITGAQTASQSDYLNAAIRLETVLTATQLYEFMVSLENRLCRQREQRWGPRTIDLDLLLFGDKQLQEEGLTIPHPRMSFRRFVLAPANEIAAEMVHPVSGMTLQQLLNHLENTDEVIVAITNDEKFVESLAKELSFEIRIATDRLEFIKLSSDARLVVSIFDESNPELEIESLMRFAKNFAGPTLEIDPSLGSQVALQELSAASEAMK